MASAVEKPPVFSKPIQVVEKFKSTSRAAFIKNNCRVKGENPKVYVPHTIETFTDDEGGIRLVEIGCNPKRKRSKVVMVVGSTGSGKTTFINAMFNFLCGVEFKDNFRFKLIEELETKDQAHSQTSAITAYTIHHQPWFKVSFPITIIDTPGFGDTQGIQRDMKITDQIRVFFTSLETKGIDTLDAVAFVAPASLPRLTATQQYIFDSVLALFGKDIANNIFMMLTFADSQKPAVLSGIKAAKIPYKKYFKFNNTAIYGDETKEHDNDDDNADDNNSKSSENDSDDDDDDEKVGTRLWKMGTKNFDSLMNSLKKTKSQSLTLTRDVLNERSHLEETLDGIEQNIKLGINTMEKLKNEEQVLVEHQKDIDRNKDFEYEDIEQTIEDEQMPSGLYAMNCTACHVTCHDACDISDSELRKCSVMDQQGNCTRCPGKCLWICHQSRLFKYVFKIRKVTRTSEELRKSYEEALGKKMTAEQIIEECANRILEVRNETLDFVEKARRCIARLDEIALRPDPLSSIDYIDLMIETEKNKAGTTLRETIGPLMDLRRQAERRKTLPEEDFEPFENCHMTHVVEIIQKKEGGKVFGRIKKVFQKKKGKKMATPQ